jgi:hypothetical protein
MTGCVPSPETVPSPRRTFNFVALPSTVSQYSPGVSREASRFPGSFTVTGAKSSFDSEKATWPVRSWKEAFCSPS